MHVLIQYDKPDGLIRGVWQAEPATTLLSQVGQADPLVAFTLFDTELQPQELLANYYIVDRAPRLKEVLTITALPSPFPADNATVCTISVAPFTNCTLMVGTTPHALTSDDQAIALTTDTPQTFPVTLAAMAQYRADPITVEATHAPA